MLKILLCISLFSLCVGSAYWLTKKYKKRKDFYYNLALFNERLLNEVSYTRIPLPAFAEKYSFSGDFGKMLAEKKEDFRAGQYNFAYLTDDEKKFLGDYFRMVGGSDAASQKNFLAARSKEIEEYRSAADNIYKKYFSLYLKLGVLAGLILIILIV